MGGRLCSCLGSQAPNPNNSSPANPVRILSGLKVLIFCCLVVEAQALPTYRCINTAFMKNPLPVDPGAFHTVRKALSTKGTPLAFVVHACIADGLCSFGVDQHQVGMVAASKVASFFDAKQGSRCVTHFFHHGFQGKNTLLYQGQHG